MEVLQAATCRPLCDKSHRQYDSHQVAAAKHFSPTLLAHLITFSPAPQMSPAIAFVAQSTHPPARPVGPPHFLRYQRKIWKIQEKHLSYLQNSCSLVSVRLINVKISAVFAVINVFSCLLFFLFHHMCLFASTHTCNTRETGWRLAMLIAINNLQHVLCIPRVIMSPKQDVRPHNVWKYQHSFL